MVERVRPKQANGGGVYFTNPTSSLKFINTGCSVLNCAVGGGWPLGRMVNIIGDNSTGKTLLAIEAAANFSRKWMGRIKYREAEGAFIPNYAEALGLRLDRVDGLDSKLDTIEQMHDELVDCVKEARGDCAPALFIIDSLDAVSSNAEKKRKITDEGYKLEKPRMMSEIFRRMTREVEASEVCLIVISQTRNNIGVMFGDKFRVSGGDALKFYASTRVMLSKVKGITETIKSVKREVGVRIRAKCIKNKVGLPQRRCEFVIRYGYGVDDYRAAVEWLMEHKRVKELGVSAIRAAELMDEAPGWDGATYRQNMDLLNKIIPRVWAEVETEFLPKHRKYD